MKEVLVYHGSADTVEHPICKLGRPHLDFGQGFYLTDMRGQAVRWAQQVARRKGSTPVLNRYRMDREAILREAQCKIFTKYDKEWLDFIAANRLGQQPDREYDYIEGGIANDRVIDTVNLYLAGLMDEETALIRLSQLRPNNQICILSQEMTDKHLIFDGTEPAE